MALFATSDSHASRRLLFVVGIALIVTGLVWSWLDSGPDLGPGVTPEDAADRAEAIHRAHHHDEEEEASAPSEFESAIAALDFSEAPKPLPERVDGEDYDLVTGTHGEFLNWFFDAIGYTAERIAAGDTTAVPPVVFMHIPRDWAEDKSVQMKKSLFYRVLLPVILLENDAVLEEREDLEAYRKLRLNRAPIPPEVLDRARQIAVRYRVIQPDDAATLDDAALEEALRRVDAVPPSLALAQAASESGYGTSRFAHQGNALFGQWDWSKDAIKPDAQREGMGNYGIKAFPHPADSVRAYLWNLNTHRAYADFRALRETQRDGRTGPVALDGPALAGTLLSYSERGEEYTREIQGIISYNQLTLADDLRVMEGDPVYLQ